MTQLRTCLNFATARALTEAAVAVGRTIDNCVQTFMYMIKRVFVSASNRFYRANIKELPMTIAQGFSFVYCTLVQYHSTWICEISNIETKVMGKLEYWNDGMLKIVLPSAIVPIFHHSTSSFCDSVSFPIPVSSLVTQSYELGITLMARDRIMTMVKSEIVLSIIINILARRVMGKASVGLNAVAVLYPRYR